jgi:hypothetical protein
MHLDGETLGSEKILDEQRMILAFRIFKPDLTK